MSRSQDVLIIGAGIAGMKASLLLARAGKKVQLVEKLPLIGGKVIKNEESFPNLECSTCMVAPVQQDVLQDPNIATMTLSKVEKIEGEAGNFRVTVRKKARYVSMTDCIGCGMCYEPCPVSLDNEWEENLGSKKAIYVPCAGSLPNVPVIDPEQCLKLNGKQECSACADSCMFGAVKLDDEEELLELEAGAIIIATGAETFDLTGIKEYGYGEYQGVYTPFEFERLFASNGPTLGELTIRGTDQQPEKIAIVHCVGREQVGYCSGVCCMYSMKFAHFIKKKIPGAQIHNIYSDVCVPDKNYQKFFTEVRDGDTTMVFSETPGEVKISQNGSGLELTYPSAGGQDEQLAVDMIILAAAIVPGTGTGEVAEITGVELGEEGFLSTRGGVWGSVETSVDGIYVAGTVEGPKDIQTSVLQAEAAVSMAMTYLGKGN